MNITLRQLQALTALVRAGSFTRAAESLHVTQSALSGLIKELETQMGVRLVDRSTRRIALSEVGREFHAVAARILGDLDRAVENVDNLKRLQRGIVRVAAPQLMASTLVPGAIAGFLRDYPGVQVQLRDCAVEDAMALVSRGEVDLSLGPHRAGLVGLDADPLFDLPFMAVFPSGHPLEKKRRVQWLDLKRSPFIALQGQFMDQLIMDLGDARVVEAVRPAYEVAFMSTALGMVHAGLGVTVCLPYARTLVDLYGLRMRPLVDPQTRRRFFVYRRQRVGLTPAAEAFVAHLRMQVDPELTP